MAKEQAPVGPDVSNSPQPHARNEGRNTTAWSLTAHQCPKGHPMLRDKSKLKLSQPKWKVCLACIPPKKAPDIFCHQCQEVIPSDEIRLACRLCQLHVCARCLFLPGDVVAMPPSAEEKPDVALASAKVSDLGVKMTPRTASAGFSFGLPLDAAAQDTWAGFGAAASAGGKAGAQGDAEVRLADAARRVAEHLCFLEMGVMSDQEMNALRRSDSSDVAQASEAGAHKEGTLECYSPFAGISMEEKKELIQLAQKSPFASRAVGGLVGLVVADAAGAPLEFLAAVDRMDPRHHLDITTLEVTGGKNKFRVADGQWTDDSAMGLCMADSLLAKWRLDGSDMRVRFHNWWFRGYNNAFGNDNYRVGSVGLGGNVAKSLAAMRPGEAPPASYSSRTEDAGNGCLMRLCPVPIYYSESPVWAAKASAASSATTHPGSLAAAASSFLGFAIASAIMRPTSGPDVNNAKAFVEQTVAAFVQCTELASFHSPDLLRVLSSSDNFGKEECWNWKAGQLAVERSLNARGTTYNGYPCSRGYFGSFCLDGLAVALWSFYHSTSYMDAIVRSINILGDADTNGAICGQLAGAFYGYESIDRRLLQRLKLWDDLDTATRAILLYVTRVTDLGPQGALGPKGWEVSRVEAQPAAAQLEQQPKEEEAAGARPYNPFTT